MRLAILFLGLGLVGCGEDDVFTLNGRWANVPGAAIEEWTFRDASGRYYYVNGAVGADVAFTITEKTETVLKIHFATALTGCAVTSQDIDFAYRVSSAGLTIHCATDPIVDADPITHERRGIF